MSEYVIPTDKLLLGGHLALGNSVSIETASGAHGIDFPNNIKFNKISTHEEGIQTDTYKSENGTNLLAFENNRLVFKVPTTLTNIDLNGLTTASISSQNYANQSLEHELDALTTAQNTILARTQGLTASKIMKSNGSGILSVSSLTEGNVNTLSDNQTVSGDKTHSGDIIISDLTTSKLVLTDANKKLVSASITESDLFKLNQDTNTQNGTGSGSVVQTIVNQSSDASNTNCAIRLTKGTNTLLSMEMKIAGPNCFLQYSNQMNFTPNGGLVHTQLKDTGLNLFSSSHKYMIAGSQISSANLSNDANLVKLDTSENNFTGIVDAASFKQGNTALNFSHLTGSASTGQIPSLPTSQITSGTFDIGRLPSLPTSQITSGTFDIGRLPSLPTSQITSGTLAIARIPSLPASQISSGTIADARLNTNILRDDDDDQTISSSQSSGTNLRIRHTSNFSTGDPAIILEDYTQLNNNLHSGIITLDNLSDVAIKTSKDTGGVVFYNNTNTFLGRLDNSGMNIKSGLSYKVNGVALQSLTTGTQTIAGVKTFSSKPVFSAGITSSSTSSFTSTNIVGNLVQSSGTTDLTGNVNVDGNLTVESGHTTNLTNSIITGTLNQINGEYSTNGKISSTYNGSFQALDLRNGQSGGANEGQISFSYNGASTFSHIIKSTHSSSNIANSSLDFHINDTTSASNLLSGTTEVLRVRGDAIETKKPIINGCSEVAQYSRFLISMLLGEAFIDTTRPIKMKCNLYKLATLDNNNHKHLRVDQTSTGENGVEVKGLGQSGNLPNSSNPNPIIVYHSTSENSTSHSDTAIFALDYESDTAFGVVGGESFLSCEGYLYKNASANNNFNSATKTATRSFWGLRVRNPDNCRIYIDNKIIFMQNTQNSSLYQAVFTMTGHFAHIKVEVFSKNSTAFVNLVFHCIGTSS
tara:strand:+ start:348 stop:3122 length:2775 start_codon:yes stop_codon:yes gene_type:complete